MANIGEIAELINSRKVRLDVGSDSYIAMQNTHIHIGRPEFAEPIIGVGTLYHFGKGDNWFSSTLLATTPEITSLNTLTQIDTDGDMTSTAWKLVYTARGGTIRTLTCTGVLREFDIEKGEKGGVKMDIWVRITGDTIAVAAS